MVDVKQDWADEVVNQLNIVCGGIERLCNVDIAIQLRKAKSDGMREAAEMVEGELVYGSGDSDAGVVILNIRAAADYLQHHNTKGQG